MLYALCAFEPERILMARTNGTILHLLKKDKPLLADSSKPASAPTVRMISIPSFPRRACPREGVGRESTVPYLTHFQIWQYVFSTKSMAVDPRSGKARRHHLHENVVQKAVKRVAAEAGISKQVGCHTLRHCHASSGGALRHSYGPGTAGPCQRRHYHDLYARIKSAGALREESGG